jgi:hypothetical protein
VGSDGITVNAGKTYGLTKDWLIDESVYSPRDLEVAPNADPSPDELDYALLALSGSPGADPVGGDTNDPNPVARKWIEIPVTAHDFDTRKALFIVQHPDGKPMQVALDTNSVIALNGNKTRVRYTTTTQPGSSGSPCFNADWEWVALHHSGDPKYAHLGLQPEFNQGIPLASILLRLKTIGKSNVVGGSL